MKRRRGIFEGSQQTANRHLKFAIPLFDAEEPDGDDVPFPRPHLDEENQTPPRFAYSKLTIEVIAPRQFLQNM